MNTSTVDMHSTALTVVCSLIMIIYLQYPSLAGTILFRVRRDSGSTIVYARFMSSYPVTYRKV